MSELYNRIVELCENQNITITKMCKDSDTSRASLSDLKMGRKQSLASETLSRISSYFMVPIDYFLERGPFFCWKYINENRATFLYFTGIPSDVLQNVWGINIKNPGMTPLLEFIRFVGDVASETYFTEEGDLIVKIKEAFNSNNQAPTPEGERLIENPDIRMIARAGRKMTPEQAENLRKYAQYMFPEAFKDDDT